MKKPHRNTGVMIVARIAAVLIAGGAIVGCSSASQDEPAGAATAAAVDSARSDATAESAPDTPVRASKPLPEGYPRDIAPIYQPSTIRFAFTTGAGKTFSYMILTETSDSVDTVAAALADDYKSRGAKISVTPLNEKGTGQLIASNDGYGIIMTYSPSEEPGVAATVTYDVHKQAGRG